MRQLAVLVWLVAACGGGAAPDAQFFDWDASPDATGGIADAAPIAPDAAVAPSDLERLQELVLALPIADDPTALLDEFFAAVNYGEEGFPIVEDGMLAVAGRLQPGVTWTLAGDFNGWDATSLEMIAPRPGLPFFYAIVPVENPTGLYKLVADGTEYFADPYARRYGYDGFGEYSLIRTSGTHLERWVTFSQGVGALEPRSLHVFVPGGPAPAGGYRVVYMHDGQNLFDPGAIWGGWHAWEAAESAIAAGVEPFLIVGIPNTPARIDEYTPVTELIGGAVMGGRADEYVAFLVDGVKPFIDARYPTRTGPEDTAVVGSSLGGVISYYALWARPDVFGHAGSLSGAFWFGSGNLSNPTVMHQYGMMAPPATATFYLDSGGDDGAGCLDSDGDGVSDDGDDADGYCQTLDMLYVLEGLGFSPVYRWDPGAGHNEAAWAARLPDVFIDWFPGN